MLRWAVWLPRRFPHASQNRAPFICEKQKFRFTQPPNGACGDPVVPELYCEWHAWCRERH
jgi:hypothetical protein